MRPEPSVIVSSFLLAGMRHRLTGKSSTNYIDWRKLLTGQRGHIFVAWHVRPVLRQDTATPVVFLHLPRHREPCAFEPYVHAPYSTKQTPDTH